jgi:hypothetical protein
VRGGYAALGAEAPEAREAIRATLDRMLAGELEVAGPGDLGLGEGPGADQAALHISMALALAVVAIREACGGRVLKNVCADDLRNLHLF